MSHDPYAQKNPHGNNDPYSNRGDPYARKSPNVGGSQKKGSNFLLYIFIAVSLGVLLGLR